MEDKSSTQRIVSKDGLDICYWVNYNKDLTKNFVILRPASSMNRTSLQNLEQGLNKRGFPTINFDPRGTGYSKAPAKSEYFILKAYTNDLRKIIEKQGLKKPAYISHRFGFMPIIDYVSQTSNAQDITGICATRKFPETFQYKKTFPLFDKGIRYVE